MLRFYRGGAYRRHIENHIRARNTTLPSLKGMTYREPARRTTRRTRIRWIRVAGLLVVVALIAASLGYALLASSSSTAASPIYVLGSEHRGAVGEPPPGT